jgi:hypothetical protein
LPHAVAKATEAAAAEATEATTTATSTRSMAGTPTLCLRQAGQTVPEGEPMFEVRRREFIALLGGVAASWPPPPAGAQQMPVIGFLGSASPTPFAQMTAAFREGLKEVGFVEGHSVTIEYRWAEGQYDRLPSLRPIWSNVEWRSSSRAAALRRPKRRKQRL